MHNGANQYFSTKEKYIIMSSKGIAAFWRPRPIDELYLLLNSSLDDEFEYEVVLIYITKYGYVEVYFISLILDIY